MTRNRVRNKSGEATTGSYDQVHLALMRVRGPAKYDYVCECGEAADEWALNETRAQGRIHIDEVGRYSNRLEDYDALCKPCHVSRDKAARSERNAAFQRLLDERGIK